MTLQIAGKSGLQAERELQRLLNTDKLQIGSEEADLIAFLDEAEDSPSTLLQSSFASSTEDDTEEEKKDSLPFQYESKVRPEEEGPGYIDMTPARTPEEALFKARLIRSAALAPLDPANDDLKAAAMADQMESEAAAQITERQRQASGMIFDLRELQALKKEEQDREQSRLQTLTSAYQLPEDTSRVLAFA